MFRFLSKLREKLDKRNWFIPEYPELMTVNDVSLIHKMGYKVVVNDGKILGFKKEKRSKTKRR